MCDSDTKDSITTEKYVEFRYYRLNWVRIWREEDSITGFDLIFDTPSDYSGWPRKTLLYGKRTGSIRE